LAVRLLGVRLLRVFGRALIQLRPDLVVPVPADVSALAVRAQSRGSVVRCLDGLDEFTLQILDAASLTRAEDSASPKLGRSRSARGWVAVAGWACC
jgi:hypothetical protein